MPIATVTSGAGTFGAKCSRPSMRASITRANSRVGRDVSGRCRDDRHDVTEEAGLGDMYPQEFGKLVQDDDQADSGLETGEHRVGDQVGHHAEAQQAAQQQEHARQERQGG